MEKEVFSPMAIDALGEMMNISLGSSATAVSNMLDHRVDITTPTVSVVDVKEFSLGNLEPAIGVEIKYVEGLEGSNIMLLKRSDIKIIVDILMGMETADEDFELNELTISCVCEVMNQMMGSAATAMSDFLGFRVDISTPQSFELDDLDQFKRDHLPQGADQVVVVRFFLKIENALESEFMNVMSVGLAKELVRNLGLEDEITVSSSGDHPAAAPTAAPAAAPTAAPEPERDLNRKMSQEEIEAMLAGGMPAAPQPEPEPERDSNRKMSQEEIEAMLAGGTPAAPAPAPSGGDKKMSQEEIERMMAGMNSESSPAPTSPPQQPAAPQQPAGAPAAQMGQPGQMPMMPYPPMPGSDGQMPNGYMGYPPMYYPPYPYPYPPQPQPEQAKPEPKVIATKPVHMEPMDPVAQLGKEQAQNLDLIMEVPLQVTVEIGRARRKVQDILEFAKGSLVVLDKLAGDQVDLFVNGKCIARGEVVVIEDNFGVRITEIVQTPGIEMLATGK